MGFFSSIRKQINTTFASRSGYTVIHQDPQGIEREITKLLNSCKIDATDPKPRQWARLSRLIYQDLGIYEAAIDIYCRLVGTPYLPDTLEVSGNTREVVDKFISNASHLHELQPNQSNRRGLVGINSHLVTQMLVDGTTFLEERYKVQDGMVSDEYMGGMTFDPYNFHYRWYSEKLGYVLEYLNLQFPELNENMEHERSPFFHVAKLQVHDRDLWGLPLIAGGRLLANVFMTLLIIVKVQAIRFGNPVSMTIVSQKDLNLLRGDTQGIFQKSLKDLRLNLKNAHKASAYGTRSDLIQSVPGDIDVVSKTFGADFNNWIDDDTLWSIALLFCVVTNIPPSLFAIRKGTAGLQSKEFDVMFKMTMAKVRSIRNVLKPLNLSMIRNYLISINWPQSEIEKIADLAYNDLDMLTDKEKAEVRRLNAEADQKHYEVLDGLRAVSDEAAREYARQNKLIGYE